MGLTGSLVIKSSGTTTLSGSGVNILTPSFFMGATGSAFVSGSNNNLELSSSKFHMKSSGDLIVRKIDAIDGTIGGYDISSGTIEKINSDGGIKIDSGEKAIIVSHGSSEKVRIGDTSGGDAFGIKGIGDGGSTLFVLGAEGNLIADWEINETKLAKGTDIVLDAGSKKITINDTTFGNTGIQLEYNSGNPRAFIGKSNGGFIKFDSSSQLQISSSGFILGQSGSGVTTGAFLSGSKEGKLEISSSKFHLKSDGSVIVSGDITITGGDLAGVNTNTISC